MLSISYFLSVLINLTFNSLPIMLNSFIFLLSKIRENNPGSKLYFPKPLIVVSISNSISRYKSLLNNSDEIFFFTFIKFNSGVKLNFFSLPSISILR